MQLLVTLLDKYYKIYRSSDPAEINRNISVTDGNGLVNGSIHAIWLIVAFGEAAMFSV